MKIKSYRILFRVFSYLSDRTNGAPLFVKYKLLLGTVIIGMGGFSCIRSKPAVYTPVVVKDSNNDTTTQTLNISDLLREPKITCYISTMPKEKLKEQDSDNTSGSDSIPPIPAEGSLEKFLEWIGSNIRYPESMLRDEVQGKVIVDIVIDETGNLTDIRILKNLVPEADKEVLRILSLSRKWTPAENDGQKVKTKITIPVTFRLPKD